MTDPHAKSVSACEYCTLPNGAFYLFGSLLTSRWLKSDREINPEGDVSGEAI